MSVNGSPKKTVSYAYDKLDRLSAVSEGTQVLASYDYDLNGNRSALTYSNGMRADYSYNLANLVTSLTNKKGTQTLSSYAYTYNLDGNQKTKSDHTGRITSYLYDDMGRLKGEAETGAVDAITKAYTFDAASNRSAMTVSGAENYSVSYDYDLNNRLRKSIKAEGDKQTITESFYDNNGNQISVGTSIIEPETGSPASISLETSSKEVWLYDYDGFNRMTAASNDGNFMSYTYRPDGLRSSKEVNGEKSIEVWEGQMLALELDESGGVIDKYIRGTNLIRSDLNGFYIYNAHGGVVRLGNSAGAVTKNYLYDAFGNEKNIDEADANPFRYSGEYLDLETNTYYLRARYYDPSVGRFGQEDPARDGTNWYVYGNNNPVSYFDPTGLRAEGEIIKRGKGEAVDILWIQMVLSAAGYTSDDGNKLNIDGSYGGKTRSAVIKYQKDFNLSADGTVGDETWNSLLELFSKQDNVRPDSGLINMPDED